MEVGSISSAPRSVEEIYKDYSGRRAGIIRALTNDVDEFYAQCDPGESPLVFYAQIRPEKENLCLYGHPNDSWEVNLPAEEVPPELPEPALGINFARDGMERRDWLSLIAVHSDSWLLSVAFYLGARLNRNERCEFDSLFLCFVCAYVAASSGKKRLFSMINELPSVFEVVSDRRQSREKSSMDSGSKSKTSTKRTSDGQIKSNSKTADEGYGEDDDEHSETLCGACGGSYSADEFWIACDVCERWFHGKCVKITPAKAESIKQYKCPSCSSKKGRQ
ncbi:PHD finger protein [Musa troglodytarum]|uniref:PHD finger protein ALFIN-LIKE n=1 Tax=Musa troglodytarum TaxID=320322 RepID=A0A9E7F2W8_9LILI|nr:PHD finger protein [Musa troglodytarum]